MAAHAISATNWSTRSCSTPELIALAVAAPLVALAPFDPLL